MPEQDVSPEWKRVGSTIKEFREMRGIRADELAAKLRPPMSRPHLANIEAGRKRLKPETAAQIAELLAVRPISILRPDEFPADVLERERV